MKSKEADYTINYSIDYTNGRENPIEVAISLLWNAPIHFIFLSRIEGDITLPRTVSTHIICWTLLVFIWVKAVKKSYGVIAEKIQVFAMV